MKKGFSLLSIFVLTALCLLMLPTRVQAATATEGPLTYVIVKGNALVNGIHSIPSSSKLPY